MATAKKVEEAKKADAPVEQVVDAPVEGKHQPVRRFRKGRISAAEFQNSFTDDNGNVRVSKMFALDKRYSTTEKDEATGDTIVRWKSSNSYTIPELGALKEIIETILSEAVQPVKVEAVVTEESQ